MICGCGRPPCVKRGTTNDGVVRKGVIDDKEIDLLDELLKVRPNGYGKVMVPTGKTLVPPNPTNGMFNGRRCSLSIPIYWNAG